MPVECLACNKKAPENRCFAIYLRNCIKEYLSLFFQGFGISEPMPCKTPHGLWAKYM